MNSSNIIQKSGPTAAALRQAILQRAFSGRLPPQVQAE